MKNMGLNEADKLASAENTLTLFGQERNALNKGGLNVDELSADLSLQIEEAKGANAQQESLKRQLRAATKVAVAKMTKAYVTASGMLDMAMAAVEKTSDAAKNFRRIRSRIHMPDLADEAEPLPQPTPNPM